MKREILEPKPWFGDPVDQCVLVIQVEHWYIIASGRRTLVRQART